MGQWIPRRETPEGLEVGWELVTDQCHGLALVLRERIKDASQTRKVPTFPVFCSFPDTSLLIPSRGLPDRGCYYCVSFHLTDRTPNFNEVFFLCLTRATQLTDTSSGPFLQFHDCMLNPKPYYLLAVASRARPALGLGFAKGSHSILERENCCIKAPCVCWAREPWLLAEHDSSSLGSLTQIALCRRKRPAQGLGMPAAQTAAPVARKISHRAVTVPELPQCPHHFPRPPQQG